MSCLVERSDGSLGLLKSESLSKVQVGSKLFNPDVEGFENCPSDFRPCRGGRVCGVKEQVSGGDYRNCKRFIVSRRGRIRRRVRYEFVSGLIGIDDVVREYKRWLFAYTCYILLADKNGLSDVKFVRCPKRGDWLYSKRVLERFEGLIDRFEGSDVKFYDYGVRGVRVHSPLISLVLEYDANKVSCSEAYLHKGHDFNRFMSLFRRRFGRVAVVQVTESHESGYPHIHVILGCLDYVFEGMFRNGRYMISGVDSDGVSIFSKVESCWHYGFVRNRLVDSFSGGVRYQMKYLVKNVSYTHAIAKDEYGKGVKTLALCWLFGKRSFGISGVGLWTELLGRYGSSSSDVIYPRSWDKKSISNSNLSCEGRFSFGLISNSNLVEDWRFLGYVKSFNVLWDDNLVVHRVSAKRLCRFGDTDRFVLLDGSLFVD